MVVTKANTWTEQHHRGAAIGVVLICVATGDLEDTLVDQGFERVLPGASAPLRNIGGDERGGTIRAMVLTMP